MNNDAIPKIRKPAASNKSFAKTRVIKNEKRFQPDYHVLTWQFLQTKRQIEPTGNLVDVLSGAPVGLVL